MIIRSQNKKALHNFDKISTIQIVEKHEIYAYFETPDDSALLGKYSTEEKTIKVLDMIQSAYIVVNDPAYKADPYFEMPQDNEVEE